MRKLTNNQGFTIVELMIALSVLSTILLMSTVILIQIGSIYSKGVNEANLQSTNRTIVSDLSSALQFSGNQPSACIPPPPLSPTPPISQAATSCYAPSVAGYNTDPFTPAGQPYQEEAFCIGTTRYTFVLNSELGTDQGLSPAVTTPHVLWRDTLKAPSDPCFPLDFTATPNPSADDPNSLGGYEMASPHMRLTRFKIYPNLSTSNVYNLDIWMAYGDSDLVKTETASDPDPGLSTCSGGIGTQYCATSLITTTVTGRLY